MTAHPRPALAAAKRAVLESGRVPLAEGLRVEARLFAQCQSDPATLELQQQALRRYAETPADTTVLL